MLNILDNSELNALSALGQFDSQDPAEEEHVHYQQNAVIGKPRLFTLLIIVNQHMFLLIRNYFITTKCKIFVSIFVLVNKDFFLSLLV